MNRWLDLRLGACVLVVALGTAAAWHALAPRTYVASARVIMVPDGGAASRIVKLESAALDPAEARSHLSSQLVGYPAASLIDAPSIASPGRNLTLDLAIGGGLGLAFGAALTVWQARRRRPVRKERDLLPLLGNPLLAARPLQPEALRALARQLDEHWFGAERKLLPVVSAGKGDGRSRVVIQLAERFAQMGARTLVIDANLRSPALHRAFGPGIPLRGFAPNARAVDRAVTSGRINQSVCLWCYKGMSVEQMAPAAAELGLKGIDLLTPEQWAPLKAHGLICTMTSQAHVPEAGASSSVTVFIALPSPNTPRGGCAGRQSAWRSASFRPPTSWNTGPKNQVRS